MKTVTTAEPFVTAREIAALLDVPVRFVVDKARSGHLPGRRIPGSNKLRFRVSEVEAAMERTA